MIDGVSVIIPNWNGKQHLSRCLDSLMAQTVRPEEVIVVDDASTDDSLPLLQRSYPWVRTIALTKNRGFTAAVNAGVAASHGRVVALLNNDTELHPNWLAKLLEALSSDASVGSVASKMVRFTERSMLDGAGDLLSRGVSPYTRGFGEPDDGRYARREYIFGACAGAALYRREVFERVGGMDEDFVAYYDDVDLAFRAQLAGFRCLYEPGAICYHKRGATSGSDAIQLQERNLTALLVKDLPGPLFVRLLPAVIVSRVRRLYRLMRAGAGRPALRGFVEGFGLLPRMLAKRRQVQRLRQVPLSYLRSLMGEKA